MFKGRNSIGSGILGNQLGALGSFGGINLGQMKKQFKPEEYIAKAVVLVDDGSVDNFASCTISRTSNNINVSMNVNLNVTVDGDDGSVFEAIERLDALKKELIGRLPEALKDGRESAEKEKADIKEAMDKFCKTAPVFEANAIADSIAPEPSVDDAKEEISEDAVSVDIAEG